MTAKVFLHVGPHKTGSTYLQAVLGRNKATLAEEGVLFPGTRYAVQRRAVQEVLQKSGGGPAAALPHWDRVVAEIRRWEGPVAVLSQEGLAGAGEAAIARLVRSLEPMEVHVVYAARDLTKVIPGGWHTRMRNGHTESWTEFLERVRGQDPGDSKLWQAQDPRLAFERWGRHVPHERLHVVTVPPSGVGQEVLWERFCAVVGLDARRYSLDVPRLNESLGLAETELLRRINVRLSQRMGRSAYTRLVQPTVIRKVLVRRPHQQKYALPAEETDWVRVRTDEIIGYLRNGGHPVVGDLDDLVPRPASPSVPAPDDVDLEQALDAATDVIAALLKDLQTADRRSRRRSRRRGTRRGAAAPARVRERARTLLRGPGARRLRALVARLRTRVQRR
jgi:hypothetical protein